MKKSSSITKELLFSVVSILACCAMFAGITFAWFSSSVTNSGNRIKAGTLNIRLFQNVASEGQPAQFEDISEDEFALFELNNWAPGDSETKELRIYNKGSLDVKFSVKIVGLTNLNQQANMADDIDVFVNSEGAFALSDFADGRYALLSGEISAPALGEDSYANLDLELIYSNYATVAGGELTFDIEIRATQVGNSDFTMPGQPPARVRTLANPAAEQMVVSNSIADLTVPKDSIPKSLTNESVIEFSATYIEEAIADVSGISIADGEATIAAIDLNLRVDGEEVSVFDKPVVVSVMIAKGLALETLNVVYNGDYVGDLDKPAQPFGFTYDPVSGELTFCTWHFSEFSVKLTGRIFTFENGNTNNDLMLAPWDNKGAVIEEEDGTLTLTVNSNGGPYVSLRDLVLWGEKGVTIASELYIDPAEISGTFGVDVTMRNSSEATNYATERRIAFAKQADGTIKVNPAHNAKDPISLPAIYIDSAAWYTVGLSYYASDADMLACRMFVLDSNGTKIAEWIHGNLAKVNSPAAPDYNGDFDGIGDIGALWFLGSLNSSAKLRSVKVYQNDGTRYAVVSNEAQLEAALLGNADQIFVNNGEYNTALNINRNVTIIGQSRDGVIINGPENYADLIKLNKRTESRDYYSIVSISDCTATLKNLTVRGIISRVNTVRSTLDAARYNGITVLEANATIDNVNVEDIRYATLGGQYQIGIYVCMKENQNFELRNSCLKNIGKGYVVVRDFGTFVCVANVFVGIGEVDSLSQTVTNVAQNAIQAQGYSVIKDNQIIDFCYRGRDLEAKGTTACAILFVTFDANGDMINNIDESIVTGNQFDGCQRELGTYGNIPNFWNAQDNTSINSHEGCVTNRESV